MAAYVAAHDSAAAVHTATSIAGDGMLVLVVVLVGVLVVVPV
jgi:hypothetical protein